MIVERAFTSLNKHGEPLCGDRVLFGQTPTSFLAVLSDGLGSGVKANILATITTKVAMTMLEAGATLEDVVNTIGRTLPECKVRKLAYSTLTLIQIFQDGGIYVVEFDNPGFFLVRNGVVQAVESRSRQIGTLSIKEYRWQGQENDLLVAVTDGVIHAGIGASLDFGWTAPKLGKYLEALAKQNYSSAEICESVLRNAKKLSRGIMRDDATVLACKIRTKRTATVAVGPPIDPNDDQIYLQKLLAEKQKRVVCGGTTATIVARELSTEISVDLAQINESDSIPPIGHIDGINLVTEGLLTLSAVYEYLSQQQIPDEDNGATRLAKLLLEVDQVNFLVGRAINPAHQNPDLPVHLSLKQQLITKIAKVLEALGKIIIIEYF